MSGTWKHTKQNTKQLIKTANKERKLTCAFRHLAFHDDFLSYINSNLNIKFLTQYTVHKHSCSYGVCAFVCVFSDLFITTANVFEEESKQWKLESDFKPSNVEEENKVQRSQNYDVHIQLRLHVEQNSLYSSLRAECRFIAFDWSFLQYENLIIMQRRDSQCCSSACLEGWVKGKGSWDVFCGDRYLDVTHVAY
jgi:hypothetical protein